MEISEDRLRLLFRAEREALLSALSSMINTRKHAEDRKLSAKEAASYLGISLSTLYKNIQFLPHKKFGKKLVFSQAALQQFDFASMAERKAKVD
jgi:excisionase family DNA binding protein